MAASSTSGGGSSGAGSQRLKPCRGWRGARGRVDLAGVIKTRFNVTLAERGAGARRRCEPVEQVASPRKGSGILSVSDARGVDRCIRD
jgi:hypothetical protein